MATSLILMLAFGFLALMMAIAVVIEMMRNRNRIMTDTHIMGQFRSEEALKAIFSKVNNDSKYKKISIGIGDRLLTKLLFKELSKSFKDITIHKEECSIILDDLDDRSCSNVLGLNTKDGQILLHFEYHGISLMRKHRKNDIAWHLPNPEESIADYCKDGEFDSSYGCSIIYPASMSMESPAMISLMQAISNSKLEYIDEPEDEETTRVIHYVLSKKDNQLVILPQSRNVTPIGDKLLDLSYSKLDFEYAGKEYSLPMSKSVDLMANIFVRNGESVSIFGAMGTGKTTLADELSRKLANSHNTVIVYMPPQVFKDLNNLETIGQLQAAVQNFKENGQRIVFFIDEAEQLLKSTNDSIHSIEASTMLSIMDGTMQKLLNCNFVLTFNAPIEVLNKAAFRPGRMGLIVKLDNLSVDQVTGLIEELKVRNAHMVFDEQKWQKLRNSGKGTPNLAEIYSCFYPKSKQRKIEALLEELGLEGMPKPIKPAVPNIVPPSAPRVNVPPATQQIVEIPQASNPQPNHHHHGSGKKKHRDRNRR